MDSKKIKARLIVVHAKCSKCNMKRILYFTADNTYGERIVFTKSGKYCAYANLINENIVNELERYCKEIYLKYNISLSSIKLSGIVSSIYGITCDGIKGEKIDTISITRCPYCLEGKLVEDKDFGEQLKDVDTVEVTHYLWEKLETSEKQEKIYRELIRQGYLNWKTINCSIHLVITGINRRWCDKLQIFIETPWKIDGIEAIDSFSLKCGKLWI